VWLDRGGMADGIGGKETCSTGVQEIYRQTCMHIHIHTHVSDVWLDRGGMADRLV
jgi:Zn-finger nucleic acid-binding protein